MPRSSAPHRYEEIIAQDTRFTQAIEAGGMTRFERWQRNRASRDLIVTNENAAAVQADAPQNPELDRYMNNQMESLLRSQPMLPPMVR